MFNQEVTLLSSCLPLVLVSVMCTFTPPLVAQDPDAPRLTVMTLHSQEQGLGARAADALREQLTNDVRQVTVITSDVISANLEQAGFSMQDALAASDEQQLARLLRSDFFLTGTISHAGKGYQVDARLVIPRDLSLSQPLPTTTGGDVDDAVHGLVRAVREAVKQYPGYQKCMANLNGNKPNYAAALAGARSGIAAYPRASLARLCMTGVYFQQFASAKTHADSMAFADSALGSSLALLQVDSTNNSALQLNVTLFKVRGDTARERETLFSLVRADPSNTELANSVITTLGQEGRAAAAIPLVKSLVAQSPEDAKVLRNAFLVYLNAEDWADAVQVGPALAQVDTMATDTMYFVRMATAYQGLNQVPQALDMLKQGTTKYPNSVILWRITGQILSQSGQTQQALEALQHVAALAPDRAGVMVQIASIYDQENQPDSVYAVVGRASVLPNANKDALSKLALKQGTTAFKTATASKSRDDYQKAIKYLQQSNSIVPSVDAQFLIGASSFNIMQSAATDANTSHDCSLAQLAQRAANDARANLPAGTSDTKYHDPAQQMLQYIPKFTSAITDQIKKFCH